MSLESFEKLQIIKNAVKHHIDLIKTYDDMIDFITKTAKKELKDLVKAKLANAKSSHESNETNAAQAVVDYQSLSDELDLL